MTAATGGTACERRPIGYTGPVLSFACQVCGQLVFIENSRCLRCGAGLGFVVDTMTMMATQPVEGSEDLTVAGQAGRRFRTCRNRMALGCNWLLDRDDADDRCLACRLTRMAPAPGNEAAREAWAAAEAAKRRLVFQLLRLRLPLTGPGGLPRLAFDLPYFPGGNVITGHADGLITIDLAETDDARRESLRRELGEPYRTVLGHFRHEVGHFYWPLLAGRPDVLEETRARFGDERQDYEESRRRHYADGPPAAWHIDHVSAYATMHPWEDWAETFAHHLHILDALETAASFGISVGGADIDAALRFELGLPASPSAALGTNDFEEVLRAWLPLTYALNAVNRSIGRPDLYPFVLTPGVRSKLSYVHRLVLAAAEPEATPGFDQVGAPRGRPS